MALCAELDMDLSWTMAVMRSLHSAEEIAEASANMTPEANARWLSTVPTLSDDRIRSSEL
jgi:hypothetical protein